MIRWRIRRLVVLLLLVVLATSARADEVEERIVAAVEKDTGRALRLLERSVKIPSATGDRRGLRRSGELLSRELRAIGFTTRWRDGHLLAEREGTRGRRLLLIGHLDTVISSGRWRRSGERAWGSGVTDMKGGNVVIVAALRALAKARVLEGARIVVIFTGDEEQPRRPTEESRAALVEAAQRSDAALAFEVGIGSTATIARRGTSTWRLEVSSPTGHSSGIFGRGLGSGAVFAAARILARFHDELREPYLTYNAALFAGGTTAEVDGASGRASGKNNVVAARAIVTGDLRFISEVQREKTKARMRAIASEALPETRAELTFDDGYPPMPPTEANRELLGMLDEVSRDLGLGPITALDPGARGAGDASFVAPHVPVLDGLGAKGGATHTAGEWVDLGTLPEQTKRAALLIHRLIRL